MKVLVVALPGIGDALLATPALHVLRKHYPDATIDLLCMFRGTKEIFDTNADINKIIYWDFIKSSRLKSLRFVSMLRGKYDVSVNIYPQNRTEYNLISFLIGAPKRIGFQYLRRDKRNWSWLMTDRIREVDSFHCAEENFRFLRFFNITETEIPPLQLTIPTAIMNWSDEWYENHGTGKEKIVVGFHPGTATFKNHIKRRWEPEKFSRLGVLLHEKHDAHVLLFGGPEEVELRNTINEGMGNKGIVIHTDKIIQSIALMKRCNVFVSNDSALMHIAGALQLPTVGIFGPTNETYVHPWKTRYTIVHTGIECRPCFYYSPKPLTCYRVPTEHFRCIHDLSITQVLHAIEEFLDLERNRVF